MKLLTKDEAAARIGISKRSLDRLIERQRGPRITRLGNLRRTFFAVPDIDAWIEQEQRRSDGRQAA